MIRTPTATRAESLAEARPRIADAVCELNRAVHKIGMYPAEHPLVPEAIESVRSAFARAGSGFASLRLDVERNRLLFHGGPLDENNPAVEWIAGTLCAAGVAALEIAPGAGTLDLQFLVRWLYGVRRDCGSGSGRALADFGLAGLRVELVGPCGDVCSERVDEGTDRTGVLERLDAPGSRVVAFEPGARFRLPGATRDLQQTVAGVAARLIREKAAGEDLPRLLERVASALPELLRTRALLEAAEGCAAVESVRAGSLDEASGGLVARYLEAIGSPEIVDLLLGCCEGPVEEDWPRLVSLFRAGGARSVARVLAVLPSHPAGAGRERSVALLASAQAEALEAGFEAIRKAGDEALRLVLPLLRRIPVEPALAVARSLSSHPDATVRIEALRTLLALDRGDSAFLRNVEIALGDADRRVGRFVLGFIRERVDEPACQLLSRYVHGEFGLDDLDQRNEALELLGSRGTPAARDALIGILLSKRLGFSGPDLALRLGAERALGARRDAESTRALARWRRRPARWLSRLVARRAP